MGQAIEAVARRQNAVEIVARCDRGDELGEKVAGCDVVIDFSSATATGEVTRACLAAGKALVIGTTGHDEGALAVLRTAAESIPVLLSPNFSVGVNAMLWLAARATELLGPDFDIEIVEMHHRHKKDAPSGTARKLAQRIAETRKMDSGIFRHGRKGDVGERQTGEIGLHAMRGGDVVGDHTVVFAGSGERLELTHKASSREVFAAGALRAAQWVADKPPGFYGMDEVLGLGGEK